MSRLSKVTVWQIDRQDQNYTGRHFTGGHRAQTSTKVNMVLIWNPVFSLRLPSRPYWTTCPNGETNVQLYDKRQWKLGGRPDVCRPCFASNSGIHHGFILLQSEPSHPIRPENRPGDRQEINVRPVYRLHGVCVKLPIKPIYRIFTYLVFVLAIGSSC